MLLSEQNDIKSGSIISRRQTTISLIIHTSSCLRTFSRQCSNEVKNKQILQNGFPASDLVWSIQLVLFAFRICFVVSNR